MYQRFNTSQNIISRESLPLSSYTKYHYLILSILLWSISWIQAAIFFQKQKYQHQWRFSILRCRKPLLFIQVIALAESTAATVFPIALYCVFNFVKQSFNTSLSGRNKVNCLNSELNCAFKQGIINIELQNRIPYYRLYCYISTTPVGIELALSKSISLFFIIESRNMNIHPVMI